MPAFVACLGELEGCEKLMSEIEAKEGFLPEGTWLAEYVGTDPSNDPSNDPLNDIYSADKYSAQSEYCGTIQAIRTQAIRTQKGKANIQNIGVAPYHRGRGIGTALILASLLGLHYQGICKVGLEVTSENEGAVRLYHQLGFRTVRTLYKAVELAYSEAAR